MQLAQPNPQIALPPREGTHTKATLDIEPLTQQLGGELLTALRKYGRGGLQEKLYEQLLKLSTSDEKLKVELFRFVDVLPALKSAPAVAKHLDEYLNQPGVKLPAGAGTLMRLAQKLPGGETLMANASQLGAKMMSQRFIAGSNLQETTRTVERLRKQGMAFTLDLLGEAVISEGEAEAYQKKYLDMIVGMSANAPSPVQTGGEAG